jgi:hypothetical protein
VRKLKFVWGRIVLLFALAVIAASLCTPVHELGHAGFVVALGGEVQELRLGPFTGYCAHSELPGIGGNLVTAGGIILTTVLGLGLLIAYRPQMSFLPRFFIFCLLSGMLLISIFPLLFDSADYIISGPPHHSSDISMLIQRGVPAPAILATGIFLLWLALFALRYIKHLTFLYADTINYVTKDVRVKIREI